MIKEVAVNDVYPLRSKVLRPGQPIEACHYKEDSREGVFHLAASDKGAVIGIASFYPEQHPQFNDANSWRLRGMATDPEVRGQGLGLKLLQQGIRHCQARGATILWCNARTSAMPFYRKLNFEIYGDEFMIENIGPHYLMYYKY
ncbi:GNAT family N-acetyltransferase [Kangiella shandongensis]|uniref:GNAT family N-acetyltransferase n=1 Tax=Kangiella shandongensis TaxID=2763258 RepID=UPI001CBDBA92|nr:GNAT family N-acetyltransferase [Kangiella shandongensis]